MKKQFKVMAMAVFLTITMASSTSNASQNIKHGSHTESVEIAWVAACIGVGLAILSMVSCEADNSTGDWKFNYKFNGGKNGPQCTSGSSCRASSVL